MAGYGLCTSGMKFALTCLTLLLLLNSTYSALLPTPVGGETPGKSAHPWNVHNLDKMYSLAKSRVGNGCFCLNLTCACCEHFDIPKLHINDTGCIELMYLREEYGISFLFVLDNVVIINKTVSVHNPPPLCYAVPKVSAADLCVRFYNLDWKKEVFSGCLAVEAQIASVEVYHRDIGCFKFPLLKSSHPISIRKW